MLLDAMAGFENTASEVVITLSYTFYNYIDCQNP